MESIEKEILVYQAADGTAPFIVWRDSLRDRKTRLAVQTRVDRLALGNVGHTRGVGEGVHELKIDLGPGYRVYFGNDGERVVILLVGGDKSTQQKDIRQAIQYWQDYKEQ